MSERRVPRYDTYAAGTAVAHDDYCAELPTWPPRKVSSQGAYPAPTAVPSALAGGTALSDSAELLLGLIGAHHGESRERAIERAVAFYADRIGIHVLARPMPCGGGYPTPALRADSRVPAASGSDPASSPDDRATGTIDRSGSEPREGEGGRGGAPP